MGETLKSPPLHHIAPLLQEVGPLVGQLGTIAESVGKKSLNNLAEKVGLLRRARAERGAEAVDSAAVIAETARQLQHRHVGSASPDGPGNRCLLYDNYDLHGPIRPSRDSGAIAAPAAATTYRWTNRTPQNRWSLFGANHHSFAIPRPNENAA